MFQPEVAPVQSDRILSDSRLGFRAFAPGTDCLIAMPEASLIDSFAEIEDPRHPRNTLYPIEEILLLAICGATSGADDFVSIAEFGEAKLGWLRRLLPFEYGVPSHDTLTRVFGQIEPSEFERCFRAWTRRVEEKTDGQVVAVDGKTLQGSRDRASEEGLLHLVEAWATGQELMLGQKPMLGQK